MRILTRSVAGACGLSLVGLVALALAQNAPQDDVAAVRARLKTLGSRDVPAHDPSTVVRCGDEYWFFATGNGVPSYRSKDLVAWTPGPPIFQTKPVWVADVVPEHRGMGFWAPDVAKVGDRYLVYYSASTFGKNGSGIGLVWNKTLDPNSPDFGWHDEGLVVRSEKKDNFNAIDPAILDDGRNGLWLSFGSFWSGIQIVRLDPKTGKRRDDQMKTIVHYSSIEAFYIYKHKGDERAVGPRLLPGQTDHDPRIAHPTHVLRQRELQRDRSKLYRQHLRQRRRRLRMGRRSREL